MGWIGDKNSKASVDKQLKVIGHGKDYGRKRVLGSRSHRDKRFNKSVGSILIAFDCSKTTCF